MVCIVNQGRRSMFLLLFLMLHYNGELNRIPLIMQALLIPGINKVSIHPSPAVRVLVISGHS